MMRAILKPHPDTPTEVVQDFDADIVRTFEDSRLSLRFRIRGDLDRILLPDRSWQPTRLNELWQHTCCELFLRSGSDSPYYEFNFSPSRDWAAYRFHSYREGMETADLAVRVSDRRKRHSLQLAVLIEGLPYDVEWHLNLSAVVEQTDGTKSYWALKHPPGAPDFHHPDCFALQLPAPQRT